MKDLLLGPARSKNGQARGANAIFPVYIQNLFLGSVSNFCLGSKEQHPQDSSIGGVRETGDANNPVLFCLVDVLGLSGR